MSDANPNPNPQDPPVPPANPPPQNLPAPPPAASLVQNGEVKSERELKMEKDLRELQTKNAELERDNQELKKIPTNKPTPPVKVKRSSWGPLIGSEDDEEA